MALGQVLLQVLWFGYFYTPPPQILSLETLKKEFSFGYLRTSDRKVLPFFKVLISFNSFKTSAKHDIVYEVQGIVARSYVTLVPKTRIIVSLYQVWWRLAHTGVNVKDSFETANLGFYCLSYNSAPCFKLNPERTMQHVLGFESEKQCHDPYISLNIFGVIKL